MVKSEHSTIILSITQISLLRARSLSHNYAAQMGVFKGNLGA